MYVTQTDKTVGIPSEDKASGLYNQSRAGVGIGGRDRENVSTKLDLINAVATYDLGFGTVLDSASFISTEGKSDIELTFYPLPLFPGYDAPSINHKRVFINEARFTSSWGGPFQVLGGVYYENRRNYIEPSIAFQYPQSPIPGVANGFLSTSLTRSTQKQLAVFGEGTLKLFDDKLTIVGGGRYFKFDILVPPSITNGVMSAAATRNAKITGTNWKGSISYEVTNGLFVYGLFSQGFRSPLLQNIVRYDIYGDPTITSPKDGTPAEVAAKRIAEGQIWFNIGNCEVTDVSKCPHSAVPEGLLNPDSTKNYEIGIRFRTPGGGIRGSLTGYIIDWTGIPVVPGLTVAGGAAYYVNAGKARAEGIEFETQAHLPAGFDLDVSAAYTKSVLAADFGTTAKKGTRLPGSPQWNAHAGLQKNFEIGEYKSFVRGDWVYVGDYFVDLQTTPPAAGNYSLFNASAGISLDRYTLGVFVKNIANSSAATWYDNTFVGRAYRVRPRTIGVSVGAKF